MPTSHLVRFTGDFVHKYSYVSKPSKSRCCAASVAPAAAYYGSNPRKTSTLFEVVMNILSLRCHPASYCYRYYRSTRLSVQLVSAAA